MPAQTLGEAYKRLSRLENIVQRQNELFTLFQPILGYYWTDQNQSQKIRKSPCFVTNYHKQKTRNRYGDIIDITVADIVAIDNNWAGGLFQATTVEEYVPNPVKDSTPEQELMRKNGKFEFAFEMPHVLAMLKDMEVPPHELEALGDDSQSFSKAS